MKKNKSASSNQKFLNGLLHKKNAGWLALLIFVSIWMFVLGVMVGRGTAPIHFEIDPLQKELAELKKAEIQKEISRIKIDPNSIKKEKDLRFYEDLKGAEKKEKPQKKKNKASTGKKRSLNIKKQNKTGQGQKRFTIQLASFKDPKDADNLVQQLKGKGYSAYRIVGEIPEKGIWYRVRTGNFKSKEAALRIMKNLKNDGYSAFIINR